MVPAGSRFHPDEARSQWLVLVGKGAAAESAHTKASLTGDLHKQQLFVWLLPSKRKLT